MKIAVIIPYFNEPDAWVRRAIDSVLQQRVPAMPFVMAEGARREWIDALPVRHVILGKAHGDYGDTPRAVGSLLAIREGFDAVAYLDADNYYLPEHLAALSEVQERTGADVVTSKLFLIRPDGSRIERDLTEDYQQHTDTSCFLLCRRALRLTPLWALAPRPLSIIGDRVFWMALKHAGLKIVHVPSFTVAYTTNWKCHFQAIGEPPPPGAKDNIDPRSLVDWWAGLGEEARQEVRDLLGIPELDLQPK